jgi:DNA-binding NarL/FixJ family response regulator
MLGAMSTRAQRPVRVQVVDDNPALRAVACLEVEMADGMELAGEAADGQQALIVARQQHPDAILLDLDMPGMGGLEALPELRRIVPGATIVVYTSDDSPRTRLEAKRHGAADYVVKGASGVREVLRFLRSRRELDEHGET